MERRSYQTLLILAIVSALISCQASTADTSSDASAQCTIKSIEETILDAEGACRCTYSENGQTLIGPGYSIATQAQQQQLQTIFSFDADTLQKVVSGDQPLKTPQLLQLLQSAADQAVADLTTVFNDFDSYPSTAKIALVKIYHDIGLPAIKQMTLFVTHVNREDFDEAALLLQYVDDSKTEQTDYCLKQAAACAGNADLLGTCIDQQIEQGNPQNPPVVDDLPVGRQCIIDTCPAILTNNLQSVLFRNNLDFASETTLYDFYSDLLQIYNNHSSGSAAQYSDTTFQTFFNSFWNCLETCANTKPSSVYNALTKLTDEESSYFEFNANPDHNNCLGAWDRFLIAQYQELTDYEDYSFREVIKSIRIYLTKKASDFCSDDMIYDRLSVILNQYDPPLVTVPPSPTSDELTDYLIQTLSTTTCNNVGTCQSSTQTLAPKPTSTSQQVMGPDDTSDDTTSSDSTDTASTQAPAPDATTTSSDASTSSSDASTSSSDASSSSSDASTSQSDASTSSSDSTPDATTTSTSTDSSSSSSTPKKKKKYSSKAVSSSDSSSSSSSSSNSTTGSSNLVAIACSSVLLILSLLF